MKIGAPIGVAIVTICLFAAATPSPGEEPAKSQGRKVIASATVTTYIKPDGARLTFFVTTTETADKSAREANEKQVKKVRDALAALPLDKRYTDVNALPSAVSVTVTGPETPGNSRQVASKKMQTALEIMVYERDLAKLRTAVSQVAETVAENGGTGIVTESPLRAIRTVRVAARDASEEMSGPRIEWLNTAPGEARREAIRRATREAMADAEAAAGVGNLKVLEIRVSSTEDPVSYVRLRDDPESKGMVQIPIRVTVHITCEY
jgi:uncharacterized protein YggE